MFGNSMNAPKRLKRATFVTLCLVGVMIGAAITYRALAPRGGLDVRLDRLQRSAAVATTAEFTLSNSSSNFLSVSSDAPQIRSNGKWQGAPLHDRQFFWLRPGGVTNVIVPIPQLGSDVRVPFVWGYYKHSIVQRLAPRLHTRFSNLMTTLRNSRSLHGWNDPYGYLPDETQFYYITNTEPRGQANGSQRIRSETNERN
jgi:hypothetical protein